MQILLGDHVRGTHVTIRGIIGWQLGGALAINIEYSQPCLASTRRDWKFLNDDYTNSGTPHFFNVPIRKTFNRLFYRETRKMSILTVWIFFKNIITEIHSGKIFQSLWKSFINVLHLLRSCCARRSRRKTRVSIIREKTRFKERAPRASHRWS